MRLPRELNDMIIGYLRDDKPALATCSLVHSSWHASSRPHLFRSLTITQTEKNRQVLDFRLFLHDSPEIGKHIRRLCVRGNKLQRRNDDPFRRPAVSCDTLHRVILRTRKLTSLRLVGIEPEGKFEGPLWIEPRECQDPGSIERFEIDRCGGYDTDFDCIVALLNMYSSITRLSFKAVMWFAHTPLADMVALVAKHDVELKIGSLELENDRKHGLTLECLIGLHEFLSAAQGPQSAPRAPTERLTLSFNSWEDVQFGARNVLFTLGPNVQSLALDFNDAVMDEEDLGSAPMEDEWDVFDLSCYPRVSNITLTLDLGGDGGDYSETTFEQTTYFLRRVAQCRPPALRTITLCLSILDTYRSPLVDPEYDGSEYWAELDVVLSQEIPGLEKVLVEAQMTDDCEKETLPQFYEYIGKHLAETKGKEMLYFLEDDIDGL